MRVRVWQRLQDEDGISLVEMLVALVLLTVGLLVLLSTLIASAHSLSNQRWTAAANRIASAEFERLRAMDYTDPALDIGTSGPLPMTLDGRDYSLERTVSEIPADPGGTLSTDMIKRVDLTVSWSEGTTARSRAFSTAISPPTDLIAASPGGTIGDMAADPATAWVDPDTGENTQTITVTVPLADVALGELVTLSWEDDIGPQSQHTTYSSGSGVTFTFAPGEITVLIPPSELQATLELEVTVDGTTKGHAVQLQREPDEPLALFDPSISPSVIWVERPSPGKDCDAVGECENLAAVTLQVDVDGFDTTVDVDSVRVRYALHGGNYEEVSLVRTSVIDATTSRWSVTLPAQSVKFDAPSAPGAVVSRTFTFIAIRTGDTPPTEAYLSITHPVGREP